MKETKTHYIDKNNNRWSKEKFTKEQAEEFSKTLIVCYDCSDCYDCYDCFDCHYCYNCSRCSNCSNCSNCFDCYGSTNLKK